MRKLTVMALIGFSSVAVTVLAQGHNHQHQHQHQSVDYTAQFAAATPSSTITIEQCWLRLLPSHLPSAGYFVIHNQGNEPVELLAAATPSYNDVMLHETFQENGMAKMQMVGKLSIPAQVSLSFTPGGLHAMFAQPTASLQVGDTMQMELLFAQGQKVQTDCKVNPAKARTFE